MRILVIGLGQMGGSLAAAAKRAGHFVMGYNRNKKSSIYAKENGLVDFIIQDFNELEELDPEIIIIGAALKAYPEIFDRLGPIVKKEWIVTDMGSVKGFVMEEAQKRSKLKGVFLGGHPMAGTEKAGVENSRSDLFRGCRWFITKFPEDTYGDSNEFDIKSGKLIRFIQSVGAIPIFLESEFHDEGVGKVSHLPQMLSVLMAASLEESIPKKCSSESFSITDYMEMAAGGFRDMSRLAGSSCDIWEDIFFLNRENLLIELSQVRGKIDEAVEILKTQDREGLRLSLIHI